jgi:predicted metalloprotease with PDZ domain
VLVGTRYLHAPAHQGPLRVTYELPQGWAIHHPAGPRALDARTWEYPDFPVLLDTPVVAGRFDVITKQSHGVPFHHVFLDRAVGFEREAEKFVDTLMGVADAAFAMFGSFPFEHYTYVFSFNPSAHWGLEHISSTMIGLGTHAFVDPEERARGARVCAHELFHAWNVCRLKPAPFMKMDHAGGSFTEGLWVAEGFTRYYEFLLCVRAGVYTPEEFFSNVVNYFRHLEAMPAYERISAADSSLTTFLNHNKYPGSINNTIDYYDKGMLVAFDLDASLRLGEGTLDGAFREFYESHVGKDQGFTTAQVRAFFEKKQAGLSDLLHREVEGPGGLSVPRQLERLGFTLHSEKVRYLGLVLKNNAGPEIANVLDTGPAAQSGIAPEDVLTRVNGFPFSLKALKWCIANEQTLKLEVTRGHRAFTFEVAPAERQQLGALSWSGTDAQAKRIREWLGRQDFTPAQGQRLALRSFENFHGIQTVI